MTDARAGCWWPPGLWTASHTQQARAPEQAEQRQLPSAWLAPVQPLTPSTNQQLARFAATGRAA
eukprot:1164753-Prymnesium_polylepis.1